MIAVGRRITEITERKLGLIRHGAGGFTGRLNEFGRNVTGGRSTVDRRDIAIALRDIPCKHVFRRQHDREVQDFAGVVAFEEAELDGQALVAGVGQIEQRLPTIVGATTGGVVRNDDRITHP